MKEENQRRIFLKSTLALGAVTAISGMGLIIGCKGNEGEDREVSAREDTVLFPAFRKLVSKHEYDSLGEEFENNEHKLFGEDGFETMVEKVAAIEKQLGIYELFQFTPQA